ncbi:hypothetical protein KIL84_020010 [Mauremys mutica]|uniref:Uncharacterized protein n=1 Tax=Mauremys mutica TaxID=74926 RepID=A0A9D4BAT6_9SAUR|nr:hypothetical protein KIL84_020010 [Mauremys mutica]
MIILLSTAAFLILPPILPFYGNRAVAGTGNPLNSPLMEKPLNKIPSGRKKGIERRLQGKSFPKHEKWGLLQTGSGGSMDEQVSGDCDDEDGCGGSGSGEVKRILQFIDLTLELPQDCFKPQSEFPPQLET